MKKYIILVLSVILSAYINAADIEKIKIAVDIGGPTLRLEPEEEGNLTKNAVESLRALNQAYDVYFLSYCGEKMEAKTRANLSKHKVDSLIPEAKWIFVRNRPDKAKVMVERNIRLLIDDDRKGQIKDAVEAAGLQFVLFNLESRNPWQDVFIELKNTSQRSGYMHALPALND